MATYFITGATGTVGSAVVQALIDQGEHVKAGSRHPEKSREQFGDQLESVHFDYQNPDTFSEADGTDGVFLLGPPMYPDLFELIKPFTDYLAQNGPQRVVYLSAYGMEDLKELPFHAQMEEKLQEGNLDWRVVRPGFFMQNFGNYERENIEQRKVIFVPAGEGKTAFVSSEDIGRVVATLLREDTYRHQTVELTGPQPYDHFEVAALLSKVTSDTVTYTNPDEGTYRKVLADAGAPPMVADYMVPVYGMIKHGKVAGVADNVEKVTGKRPETLETVLKRDFA
ncbi:MAG: SDR family oxidoreductase [Tunicatimonas sp.]